MKGNPMPTRYVYVGDGRYLPGVPARDLTVEESEEHREQVESSALYEPVTDAKEIS